MEMFHYKTKDWKSSGISSEKTWKKIARKVKNTLRIHFTPLTKLQIQLIQSSVIFHSRLLRSIDSHPLNLKKTDKIILFL